MPTPENEPSTRPVQGIEVHSVTVNDSGGLVITGTMPPALAEAVRRQGITSFSAMIAGPCRCEEDYVCALHGTGVLEQDDRPDWGVVSAWEYQRDTALLARTLEDLAGLPADKAETLARVLRPVDGPHVEVESAVVSRTDLRRLAELSQTAGPEHDAAWAAYRAAGAETLTAWRAFVAGIRLAADYRRG